MCDRRSRASGGHLRILLAALAATVPASAFAVDTAHLFTGIHLGGNFNDPAQWTPNGVPDSDDTATVVSDLVDLTNHAHVGNLNLGALFSTVGGQVRNNAYQLNVTSTTTVDGAGSAANTPVELRISNSNAVTNDFLSRDLMVKNAGRFYLYGIPGSVPTARVSGTMDIESDGVFLGRGLLEIGNASTATFLNNNSVIRPSGGALEIRTTGLAQINLDGSGSGSVDVTGAGASLIVNGPMADSFGGTITIGEGNELSMLTWTLGDSTIFGTKGTLNLNGGAAPSIFLPGGDPAQLSSIYTTQHTLNAAVNVTGYAKINSYTAFGSGARVNVAANSLLVLTGPSVSYSGGSYTGEGTIRHDGFANINADTTIDVDTLDLDGSGTNGYLGVGTGVTFTINSKRIETPPLLGTDGFDGTIELANGTLAVNTVGPWIMEGMLTMGGVGGATTDSVLNGSKMIVRKSGQTSGYVEVNDGRAIINAPVEFQPDSILDVASLGARLQLKGATTFDGANAIGAVSYGPNGPNLAGRIDQYADATVNGDTYIQVDTYNMDGAGSTKLTINSAKLTVDVNRIDEVAGERFTGVVNLNGGQLIVKNQADAWTLFNQGVINMMNNGAIPQLNGERLRLEGGKISSSGLAHVNAPLANAGGTVQVASATLLLNGGFSSEAGKTLAKTGAGTLAIASAQSHAVGSAMNLSEGKVLFGTDPGAGGANLFVSVGSGASAEFQSGIASLYALGVANGGTAQVIGGSAKLLVTSNLNIGSTGLLDLVSNDLIVHAGPDTAATVFDQVTGWIASARGTAPYWNGFGMTSSAAKADPKGITALGAILNDNGSGAAVRTLFDGQIVGIHDVLVKYTYYGDGNLDGVVNADDYFLIDSGFISQKKGWYHGDYNYDGVTNADDYFLIDQTFIAQSGPLGRMGGLVTAVPEPSAVGLLAVGALAARRRRR